MKKNTIILILVLAVILLAVAISFYRSTNQEKELRIAKLVNIDGGDYVESAGYYEGKLRFIDIKTSENYSLFTCSKDWAWVKQNSCYKINLSDVTQNIESRKYSAMLSGCYVGTFEQTSC